MTMKMTKRDLKVMMKECLVELIQEGAFNIVAIQQAPSVPRQQTQQAPQRSLMASPQVMNLMGHSGNPQSNQNNESANFAKQAAATYAKQMGATDQAQFEMFSSIFEDTIQHTMENHTMNSDPYDRKDLLNEVYEKPEVVQQQRNFKDSETVNRWAKIAFSPSKKRLPGTALGDNDQDNG